MRRDKSQGARRLTSCWVILQTLKSSTRWEELGWGERMSEIPKSSKNKDWLIDWLISRHQQWKGIESGSARCHETQSLLKTDDHGSGTRGWEYGGHQESGERINMLWGGLQGLLVGSWVVLGAGSRRHSVCWGHDIKKRRAWPPFFSFPFSQAGMKPRREPSLTQSIRNHTPHPLFNTEASPK